MYTLIIIATIGFGDSPYMHINQQFETAALCEESRRGIVYNIESFRAKDHKIMLVTHGCHKTTKVPA